MVKSPPNFVIFAKFTQFYVGFDVQIFKQEARKITKVVSSETNQEKQVNIFIEVPFSEFLQGSELII